LTWVPVDELISTHAGHMGQRWNASLRGIGVADLIIAATADLLGADLITSNVKHFPMFPGLEPPY
jgi:predicted nucleic acid-binding protein